jgi:sterol desaturase/sphingolipid hydroxylase (fatty acid hydroxylase superfamily)
MLESFKRMATSAISTITDPLLLPTSRTFLLYLATSYLLAVIVHLVSDRKSEDKHGPIRYIFPKEVYLHRSAVVDYIYFICNTVLGGIILVPFAGLGVIVSREVVSLLGGPGSTLGAQYWPVTLALTLVLVMVSDFATFFVHLCAHRIPFLWEFHKVHHSAEVMTPLTVYRMHPVDDALTLTVGGLLVGCTDAVIRCYIDPAFPVTGIYGVTIFTFLFYLCGYNLRHSHVWLSWGPVASKIFISPAQHQIHHSKARQHWNKNFGFMFATWDYIFGSLYIPREQENIEFGIGNGQEKEYSSVLRLYFLPFAKAYRLLRRRPK